MTRIELDHEPTDEEIDQLEAAELQPAELHLRTDAGPITASDGTQLELIDATHNGHAGATLRRLDPDGWVDITHYFADGSEVTAEHQHPIPNRGLGGQPKRRKPKRGRR